MFISTNPYLNKQYSTHSFLSNSELNFVLQKSVSAQQQWHQTEINERIKHIENIGQIFIEKADELAVLAAQEIGKPILQAKAELLKCSTVCSYYASNLQNLLKPQIHQTEKGIVQLWFEPIGTVLGIFPWNFPFWQIIRSAIPIIAGGNSILVKPAPNMPNCAQALQQIFDESGILSGVFQTVLIDENQIKYLIENDNISAVTFTGSDATGSKVAEIAGKNIKKIVLELGGSDPLIILNDADIKKHLPEIVLARLQNNGQSCVAAKRFLVQKDIEEYFINELINYLSHLKVGNPLLPEVSVGPLARVDLCEKLNFQVKKSIEMGAEMRWQMPHNEISPCFFAPAVLQNIPLQSPAAKEELFGPVFCIFNFNTIDQAIELANNTSYGLGASVFTQNHSIAVQIASKIKCGIVAINKMVKSDARFPFGGVKKSGFGKELGSNGLLEFTNIKTVMM